VNYAELTTNIEDICEQSFTADQLAMFTQQAEQLIYAAVDLPAMRTNQTGTTTINIKYLTMPTNMLYVYSLAVIDATNAYHYLINKDVSFIREAYPKAANTGLPVHYAIFGDGTFILGPTPDATYASEIHFAEYPESIVTASTTWLGTEFDSALLNGALVEAIRFQKGEGDMVQMYQKLYIDALTLLKNLGAGKLETDTYRSGVVRIAPQ
jgi:hypothetical protein|tara:strand:- start:1977 stop:2606 length:630 start_codon:yes stop_codon:yes gene_type:complete